LRSRRAHRAGLRRRGLGRARGLRIWRADLPERADVGEPGAEDVEQRAQHLGVRGLDGARQLPQQLQDADPVAVDVEGQDERGTQAAFHRGRGDRRRPDAGEVAGEHRSPGAQRARQRAEVGPLLRFGEPQRAGVGRRDGGYAIRGVDQEQHRAADPEHPGDRRTDGVENGGDVHRRRPGAPELRHQGRQASICGGHGISPSPPVGEQAGTQWIVEQDDPPVTTTPTEASIGGSGYAYCYDLRNPKG
jgi:hypothetical protein